MGIFTESNEHELSAKVQDLEVERSRLIHMLKGVIDGLRDLEEMLIKTRDPVYHLAWMRLEALSIQAGTRRLANEMLGRAPQTPTLHEELFPNGKVHHGDNNAHT